MGEVSGEAIVPSDHALICKKEVVERFKDSVPSILICRIIRGRLLYALVPSVESAPAPAYLPEKKSGR